jgi:mannitol/fructose-specific phosphotransferase system IIA component (Ntr-type)
MKVFDSTLVKAKVKVSSKDELFDKMIEDMYQQGNLRVRGGYSKALKSREEVLSTGIGYGLALPHARHNDVKELKAVVYTLENSLDYDAIDGYPVNIVIMIAIPLEKNQDYMGLLHNIVAALREDETRDYIAKCNSEEEIYSFFEKIL